VNFSEYPLSFTQICLYAWHIHGASHTYGDWKNRTTSGLPYPQLDTFSLKLVPIRSLCTGSSAFPTPGSSSGTPVSWPATVLPAIQLVFPRNPRIWVITINPTFTSVYERKFVSFLVWSYRLCARKVGFVSRRHSADGARMLQQCASFLNARLKCIACVVW
jgi:hypothetical protein